MAEKTQAMRILEAKRIPYKALLYSKSERDAEMIASILGLPPSRVFKTLVVLRPEGKPALVMIPADKMVDLKKVARSLGEKKVRMASYKEAEDLTGLQVGGISALALINRGFLPLLDHSAFKETQIYVSAGKRGIQIGLDCTDLKRLTKAKVIDATQEP